ncbi:hypothetical protein [Nonomuraea fuscirosea]|uniref:hypothetical protein n=1 Tax=Nonomuraea fuscirosea TaxID=1291556 RepID=UPI003428D613
MSDQIPAFLGEVGRGWHPLLQRLHSDLLAVDPGYRVTQVKEKYGELRVSLLTGLMRSLASPDGRELDRHEEATLSQLVHAAEQESARTCEYCGAPGRSRDRPWIKTLCDTCAG